MNITPKILLELGATEEAEGVRYILKEHGVTTQIVLLPGKTINGNMLWRIDGNHEVTDLEEVIAWAYLDGISEGKSLKQREIKEVLGLNDK